MTSLEEQHIADMEEASGARKRAPIDVLAEALVGKTRKERRAFKSRLKRLVRKEARKTARTRK